MTHGFNMWYTMLKASAKYALKKIWKRQNHKSQITNHILKNSVGAGKFYGKFLRSFKYTYYIYRTSFNSSWSLTTLSEANKYTIF